MAKLLWRPRQPRASPEELAALPRPVAGFWEGKMGKRKRGEEMSERRERGEEGQKGGEGNRGKEEEEGTLLISFAPPPNF